MPTRIKIKPISKLTSKIDERNLQTRYYKSSDLNYKVLNWGASEHIVQKLRGYCHTFFDNHLASPYQVKS